MTGARCTGGEANEILAETFGGNVLWGGLDPRITVPE